MNTQRVTHPKTGLKLLATKIAEYEQEEKAKQHANKIEGGFVLQSRAASNYGYWCVLYPATVNDFANKF